MRNVDSCTKNVATMVHAYRQGAETKLESLNSSIFPEMPSAQRATGQRGSKRETRGFPAQGYKLP